MQLEAGSQFPQITATDLDGNDVAIPDCFDGSWGIVLFFRGHW